MNQKGFTPVVLMFLLVFLIGIVGGVYLYTKNKPKSSDQKSTVTRHSKYDSGEFVSNEDEEREKEKNYVVKRISDGTEKVVYKFSQYGTPEIVRWDDLLFYPDDDDKSILSHNLKTGENKQIYKDKSSSDLVVSDLQVINNTLFFSYGGYLQKGGTYWVDLPVTGEPKLLTQSRNAGIKQMGGRYWIIGGDGDSCWAEGDYHLLDINTKKANLLAVSHIGCNKGEEFLIVDKKDRFIMANHTAFSLGLEQTGRYTSIIAIPLSSVTNKITLLPQNSMPDSIIHIEIDEDNNRLVLIGKSVYFYNLNDDSLVKVLDLPKQWYSNEVNHFSKKTICLGKADSNDLLEVDLPTKQLIPNSDSCQNFKGVGEDFRSEQKERVDKLVKSLDLPSNYQLVLEDVVEKPER